MVEDETTKIDSIKIDGEYKEITLKSGHVIREINQDGKVMPIFEPTSDPNQDLKDLVAAQSAQIETLLKALNK